jgi:biopolymer transport protein ExbB
MSPLLGLLGSLIAAGRALSVQGAAWGPALGNSLIPLTSGVALAILTLVAYDGLIGRVEKLTNAIDRLGAETVDAIAMSASSELPSQSQVRPMEPRRAPHGPIRGPHQIRVEIPDSITRNLDHDDEFED